MTDRAGPPTARNALRDAACNEFIAKMHYDNRYNSIIVAAIKDGFNAGWEARKTAQYAELVNHDADREKKLVDRCAVPGDTLFPTTGELT